MMFRKALFIDPRHIFPLLFCGLLFSFASCKAQSQKGLPSSSPATGTIVAGPEKVSTVIFQDSQGRYWFGGGGEGACVYNGKEFRRYSTQDGLCDNNIIGIQEDRHHNLYFDTKNGVSKYDGHSFATLKVEHPPVGEDSWQLNPGDLWFRMGYNRNGPLRYDGTSLYQLEFPKSPQEDAFRAKYPKVYFNPYGIYSVYKDRSGRLWFGTASLGLCCFDGKTLRWLYDEQVSSTPSGGDFGFRSAIEDSNGDFWFCNTRYRFELLPNAPSEVKTALMPYRCKPGVPKSSGPVKQSVPYFFSVVEDKHGDLWMVTFDDGVWRKKGEELIHYPVRENGATVLLFSIYMDQEGGLWLGTRGAGVFRYNGNGFEAFKG